MATVTHVPTSQRTGRRVGFVTEPRVTAGCSLWGQRGRGQATTAHKSGLGAAGAGRTRSWDHGAHTASRRKGAIPAPTPGTS